MDDKTPKLVVWLPKALAVISMNWIQCAITVTFDLSADESSSNEGEEVHAYRGPRIRAPKKVVALSRAITYESLASVVVVPSADVSTNAEVDQGQSKVSNK